MTLRAGKSSTALALKLQCQGGPAGDQVFANYKTLVSAFDQSRSEGQKQLKPRRVLSHRAGPETGDAGVSEVRPR